MSSVESRSFLSVVSHRAANLLWSPVDYAMSRVLGAVPGRATEPASEALAASGSGATSSSSSTASTLASADGTAATGTTTTTRSMPLSFLTGSYLTSSYLLISLALAFVLHRIHHLVPPSTRTAAPHRSPWDPPSRSEQRIASAAVQVGARAPGILFLLKTIAGLAIAIARTHGHDVAWLSGTTNTAFLGSSVARSILKALHVLSPWTGSTELSRHLSPASPPAAYSAAESHNSLLFHSFLSIALSITCETFVRSLSDDSPTVHSFNLLSFSFLLHVHSVNPDTTRQEQGDSTQLYLYLLLTLAEIATLQVSYLVPYLSTLRPRWSQFGHPNADREERSRRSARAITAKRYRLHISMFYSLVSQLVAIRCWYRGYVLFSAAPPRARSIVDLPHRQEDLGRVNMNMSIWFSSLPELMFEAVVVLSVGLKFLATWARGEEWSYENIVGTPVSISAEEDYAVALIKFTTALLRSTRLSSLSYELSPVSVLPPSFVGPLSAIGFGLSSDGLGDGQGGVDGAFDGMRVVLARNGDVVLLEELERDTAISSSAQRDREGAHDGLSGLRRRIGPREDDTEPLVYGFDVEVKRIEVEPSLGGYGGTPGGVGLDESGGGGDGLWEGDWGMGLDGEVEFLSVVLRILFYVAYVVISTTRATLLFALRKAGLRSDEGVIRDTWEPRQVEATGSDDGERPRRARRARSGTPLDGRGSPEVKEATESDPEYEPSEDEEDESGSSSDEEGQDQRLRLRPATGRHRNSDNPLALLADLSMQVHENLVPTESFDDSNSACGLTTPDFAPYLLAHQMMPGGSRPLTRARFKQGKMDVPYEFWEAHNSYDARDEDSREGSPQPGENDTGDERQRALSPFVSTEAGSTPRRSNSPGLRERSVLGEVVRSRITMTKEEMEKKREEWRESRSAFCVVCTVEPRTIILWPCRCLVLCEPCRAALALRTTASTSIDERPDAPGGGAGENLCPTCRTGVAGFSRIYIP
ncbi:hypothetical protein JCM10212_000331 [Sporobolomyces blumeae]